MCQWEVRSRDLGGGVHYLVGIRADVLCGPFCANLQAVHSRTTNY